MKQIVSAKHVYSAQLVTEAIISKDENSGFYQINVKYMSGIEDVCTINYRTPYNIIRFFYSSAELQLVGDEVLKELFNKNFITLCEKYNDFKGFKALMNTHNQYMYTFIEIYNRMNMVMANNMLIDMFEGGN